MKTDRNAMSRSVNQGRFVAAFLVLSIIPSFAVAEGWKLLTQTEGGTMQLTRGLSREDCEFMRNRAMGWPATAVEKQAATAAFNAVLYRRQQFAKDNNCRIAGFSIWPTRSFVNSAGQCVFGSDMAFAGTGMSVIRDGDIRSAECLE